METKKKRTERHQVEVRPQHTAGSRAGGQRWAALAFPTHTLALPPLELVVTGSWEQTRASASVAGLGRVLFPLLAPPLLLYAAPSRSPLLYLAGR